MNLLHLRRTRRRLTRSALTSPVLAALEGPALPRTAARRAMADAQPHAVWVEVPGEDGRPHVEQHWRVEA
ncbi:hypothetical protein KGQ20_42905 [Catenulispora sp. NF23]|uniref:Uncharacterized protein n=1 Tax=Catenulispora pinistramenti TaxID=2705254 RepID=A0ABS5KMD0_9ACTN|nr:hypothetical protein [Catenulispora pinistramenti]MBS2539512.1 hypothetical protein [Catenulispora pinistramenti]MBS2547187.1 hypothetical protein [Catenulispora pinistramenti]